MKTKTLELANEWGLDVVEITQGTNGYPEGLYKALKGFDYFENAEDFAEQVGGEVVLISKRDGHQFWKNNGRAYGGIQRASFINESKYEIFTDEGDFEEWCCQEVEYQMQCGFNLFDMKDTLETMCDTYDEIYGRCSDEMIVVDISDYTCESVEKVVTEIHDNDVTMYAIAVVDNDIDGYEAEGEDE